MCIASQAWVWATSAILLRSAVACTTALCTAIAPPRIHDCHAGLPAMTVTVGTIVSKEKSARSTKGCLRPACATRAACSQASLARPCVRVPAGPEGPVSSLKKKPLALAARCFTLTNSKALVYKCRRLWIGWNWMQATACLHECPSCQLLGPARP